MTACSGRSAWSTSVIWSNWPAWSPGAPRFGADRANGIRPLCQIRVNRPFRFVGLSCDRPDRLTADL
jgi:hypothetical protein